MYASNGQYSFYNPINETIHQCASLEEYRYRQEKLMRQQNDLPMYATSYGCATTCQSFMMDEPPQNKTNGKTKLSSLIAYYYNRKKQSSQQPKTDMANNKGIAD